MALRSRSRHAEARYYLYVSDSKLDMLFEQIDQPNRNRISAELKIDLKLASLTLHQADDPGPTRTAKLRIVERFIDVHHHIGTIHEPGQEYFRGQMDMVWSWLGEDKEGVWFEGKDFKQLQCIGLGGSRHHVLGEPNGQRNFNYTGFPALVEALIARGFLPDPDRTSQRGIPYAWAKALDWDMDYDPFNFDFLSQRLEFLAVPLLEAQVDVMASHHRPLRQSVHVVVGSPLYVAKSFTPSGAPGSETPPSQRR